MPSVGEHKSKHVKWLFEVGDPEGRTAVRRLSADNGLIARHSHNAPPTQSDFEPDGSVFLYQDELIAEIRKKKNLPLESCTVSPGERFRLERDLEFFLDPTDFFPFFILVPTVELTFRFTGEACSDLAIKARAGGATVDQIRDESEAKDFRSEGALLPGHVVIFSWHPRAEADATGGASDGAQEEEPSLAPASSQ